MLTESKILLNCLEVKPLSAKDIRRKTGIRKVRQAVKALRKQGFVIRRDNQGRYCLNNTVSGPLNQIERRLFKWLLKKTRQRVACTEHPLADTVEARCASLEEVLL